MTPLIIAALAVAKTTPPPVRYSSDEWQQDEAHYQALMRLRDVIAREHIDVDDAGIPEPRYQPTRDVQHVEDPELETFIGFRRGA